MKLKTRNLRLSKSVFLSEFGQVQDELQACKVELLNLQIEDQFQMRLTKGTEIIYIKFK